MKIETAMDVGVGLLVATAALLATARLACAVGWCVPTFCGNTSQCPGSCVCAIEPGQVTGHCVGTQ